MTTPAFADRHLGRVDKFRLGEHRVDVVDAGEEHLRLQAAAATRAHEGVGVLKLRVPVDDRASDLTLRQRVAIHRGDDGHFVGRHHQRGLIRDLLVAVLVDLRVDEDGPRVEAVGAGRQNRRLRAALMVAQERA